MIWIKPNGIEIETDDSPATIEYAKSLGWKEKSKGKSKKKSNEDSK